MLLTGTTAGTGTTEEQRGQEEQRGNNAVRSFVITFKQHSQMARPCDSNSNAPMSLHIARPKARGHLPCRYRPAGLEPDCEDRLRWQSNNERRYLTPFLMVDELEPEVTPSVQPYAKLKCSGELVVSPGLCGSSFHFNWIASTVDTRRGKGNQNATVD